VAAPGLVNEEGGRSWNWNCDTVRCEITNPRPSVWRPSCCQPTSSRSTKWGSSPPAGAVSSWRPTESCSTPSWKRASFPMNGRWRPWSAPASNRRWAVA